MKQKMTIPFAGFSLFLLTDILSFHSTTAFSELGASNAALLEVSVFASISARIVIYLVLALASVYRKREPLPRKATALIASAVALVSLGLITYALLFDSVQAIVIGGMMFGAAQGIMGIAWLTVLPSLTYRASYLYILSSHAGATALCFILLILPNALIYPIFIICLLAANICTAFLPGDVDHAQAVRPQIGGIVPFLWKRVLGVGVFAFLSGFVSALTAHSTDALDPIPMQFSVLGVSAVVIAIMLIPALAFRQPLKLENGYKIALPLSALGFLILPGLISTVPPPLAGVLATTGYMLTGIILYCTIAEIAKAADTPSAPLFAGSDAITLMCLLVGMVIGSAFATTLSDAGTGVALVGLGSLYLIAIGASWFFGRHHTVDSALPTTSEATAPVAAPTRPSLESIAASQGFNEQETTIFLQLIEGRTIPRIAQDLFLSASTVKYHTQKIYRKFAVHSRTELAAVVEEIRETGRT